MLHRQRRVQPLTEVHWPIRALQRIFASTAMAARAVLGCTGSTTAAPTPHGHVAIAIHHGKVQSATATNAIPTSPAPTPADSGTPTAPPGAEQPTTVTQPPGLSGYLPIDYVLPVLAILLLAFLATRPGGKEAIKALVKLVADYRGNPPA